MIISIFLYHICRYLPPYTMQPKLFKKASQNGGRIENQQNFRNKGYICNYSFLNGPSPASFSFIFSLSQTNSNTILQQINVKKCPSSVWHWDSNPQP